MVELEEGGVEHHLVAIAAGAVEAIADYGGAESQGVGGVQPELMGAAGERGKLEPGVLSFNRNFPPVGNSQLAVFPIMNLQRAVVWVEAEMQTDFAAVSR
jgi:hypothetical protein